MISISIPVYAATSNVKVKLYKVMDHPTDYWLVEEEKELQVTNGAVARAVINEIIKEENHNKYLIPEGTKLLSLNLKNGLLTIDFSKEFQTTNLGHGYENLMVYTLINSLTEFSTIDRIQFWIEGKIVESLPHIYIKDPLERNESIIADVKNRTVKLYGIPEPNIDGYIYSYNTDITIINNAIAKSIIEKMIEEKDKNHIPMRTQLLSLNLKNGLLTIDFNSGFKNTDLDYYTERFMIYTIVNSLTELSTINSVQFWIEGKVVDKLAHFPIDKPFERDESINGCIIDENDSAVIRALSDGIMLVLKDKNIDLLKNYVHPFEGLRFSPYVNTNFEENLVLSKDNLLNAWNNNLIYNFGSYDGSGFPIDMTFKDYYDKFVYERDFSLSNNVTINNDVNGYLLNPRLTALYPGFNITRHYLDGENPDYGGIDWKSLNLVYQKYNNQWYLVSIIHDQWTI